MTQDSRAVVGYIRVSTREQAETKLSLTNQAERIRAHAISRELKLVKMYNDAAESAKDLHRPAVQDLLHQVEKGRIGHVIIYKLDRLIRNVGDLSDLLRLFSKKDVSLSAVVESLDTSTASGKMVVQMIGVIAEWERDTIAERTRVALDIKRQRGEALGGHRPFGWLVKGEKLIPNPKEQGILKAIIDGRLRKRGYQDIAEDLNRAGIKPARGKRWYASSVRSIWLRSLRSTQAPKPAMPRM